MFGYAAFQCVSIPAMIAASTELTHKGVKRASILGWLMNGGALAASGAMLLRWYPLLCTIKEVGVDSVASIAARHIGNVMKLPNQSVVTLMGSGYTWLFVVYTILLFCAFVSTSVTLVYSMIQRFEGRCVPSAIKSKAVRSVIVGLVVIGLCYAVSLLGLSTIISKVYGYDGYYALVVVVLFPLIVWTGASGTVTGRSARVCEFLGDISYPIYITHYPLVYTYTAWVRNHGLTLGEAWPAAAGTGVVCVLLAYAALKWYDEPVRRWLRREFM